MANKSGVPVENIISIAGVAATSITSLVGIPTTSLPGWPSSGPTCIDSVFSYGGAPGIACSAGASFYSFDSTNNLLYNFGSCGGDYAPEGFYSDGTVIYWWHTVGRDLVWEVIGECG